MMNKNKILILTAGVLFLCGLSLFLFQSKETPDQDIQDETVTTENSEEQNTQNNLEEEDSDTNPVQPRVNAAPVTKKGTATNVEKEVEAESYEEALETYGTWRVQFRDCITSPLGFTVKRGTPVLLDGFSPDPQAIYVGGQVVYLNGYNAKVLSTDRFAQSRKEIVKFSCEYLGKRLENVFTLTIVP